MGKSETRDPSKVLRLLPSVDALLHTETALRIIPEAGAKQTAVMARSVTDSLRRELQDQISANGTVDEDHTRDELLAEAERRLEAAWRSEQDSGLRRVINATGVIIHTNLGRAPLSSAARKAIAEVGAGYCTVEYNLETGQRGRRGARVEHLLAELTGAESALVVNNCAAAAFLVLTALARGGEVIISRGELVEIGGDFRVPDVMAQSGAILREVGTTNRTRVADYERAITDQTSLILKVHPSNFRIIGFTSTPTVAELAELAREHELLLYEDAGSGAMLDLGEYGLDEEPVINRSIVAGADVVTFSGDKLLGGVQAGLIVGRRDVIEYIRKHPLYRALRVDKLIYAALEATLNAYRRKTVFEEIPVLRMISASNPELRERTGAFAERLRERLPEGSELSVEVTEGRSVVGGGSAPDVQPETTLLSLMHPSLSAGALEESLRHSRPPVIARIVEDRVLVDLRTVGESEETELLDVLTGL